jgi:hypothetical protein
MPFVLVVKGRGGRKARTRGEQNRQRELEDPIPHQSQVNSQDHVPRRRSELASEQSSSPNNKQPARVNGSY